jgi:preprotein translocase subunit SecA
MRIFGGERIKGLMNRLGIRDDEPIEARMVSRQIEGAQSKVEGQNFDARKYIVEYDDVMNKQREVIYGQRRKILEGGADLRDNVLSWIKESIEQAVGQYCESRHPDNWDLEGLVEHLRTVYPLPPFAEMPREDFGETRESVTELLYQHAERAYAAKEAELTPEIMRKVEQFVMLKTIDGKWISYLTMMEHFKEGIGLRAFGQKDPLIEYKNEAFQAFNELTEDIKDEIASTIFRVQLVKEPPVPPPPPAMVGRGAQGPAGRATPNGGGARTPVPAGKIGRNDPCYCGSGKKYKKCHGAGR